MQLPSTWCALALCLVISACCFTRAVPSAPSGAAVAPPSMVLVPVPEYSPGPYDNPVWGLSTVARSSERARIPQLWDARRRFEVAPAREVAPFTGVWICRVLLQPGGSWDLLSGGPDLYLTLHAGSDVITTDEGRGDGYFTFPVVDLTNGASIALDVDDHDLLFDDRMASGTSTFDGRSPMSVSLVGDPAGLIECRAAEPVALEADAGSAAGRLDRALDAFGAPRPDLREGTLGWPVVAGTEIREALTILLALRGHQHPDAISRLARMDAAVSAYRQTLGDAVTAELATLPARGDAVAVAGITGAVPSIACGDLAALPRAIVDAAPGAVCIASLRFHAPAAIPLAGLDFTADAQSLVIDAHGDVAALVLLGASYDSAPALVRPPRDARTDEEVTLWWTLAPPADGALVSIALGGGRPRVSFRP